MPLQDNEDLGFIPPLFLLGDLLFHWAPKNLSGIWVIEICGLLSHLFSFHSAIAPFIVENVEIQSLKWLIQSQIADKELSQDPNKVILKKDFSLWTELPLTDWTTCTPIYSLKLKTSHMAAPESSEHSSQRTPGSQQSHPPWAQQNPALLCLHWGETESQSILSVPEASLVQILAFCTPNDHICQIQQDIKEVKPSLAMINLWLRRIYLLEEQRPLNCLCPPSSLLSEVYMNLGPQR